jgi:hypothetical protein
MCRVVKAESSKLMPATMAGKTQPLQDEETAYHENLPNILADSKQRSDCNETARKRNERYVY